MKIGIIGLGLIGGSLGLDLRQRGYQVFGVSRSSQTCEIAKERGVVDEGSVDLAILKETELIYIATPISAIAPTLEKLLPYLAPETIVTDVGSVKEEIVRTCSELWPNFVGGHPMAGNIQQGIEAAQLNLFAQAPYVITPIKTTPIAAQEKVGAIASSLNSKVYYCTPENHDQAVAWISHLPVMISANLIASCIQETDSEVLELAQKIASSGFRDTSRVGGGNVELGVMMARYNRSSLLSCLKQYRANLEQLSDYLETGNWSEITKILQETQQSRPNFTS